MQPIICSWRHIGVTPRVDLPSVRAPAVIEVDPSLLDDKLQRVNISLPRRVLHRLDALARASGETRSGLIARLALQGHQGDG